MSSVNPFPQSLADVVSLAMKRHGVDSGRALAAVSRRAGTPVTYTVLNQLLAGQYRRRPTPATRKHLASLSGVRLEIVDQLAGVPANAPFQLPEDAAASLTGDQREAVLAVVRAFAAANARENDEVIGRAAYKPDYPMQADQDPDSQGDAP